MIYTYVATAIVAAAATAVATWQVQDWRYAAKEAERLEAQREKERNDRKAVSMAASAHEADKEALRTEFITITQEVERVVEKPVYRDVCLDDDGLRALRRAIRGSDAGGEPAPAVPGPAGAR